jgi:hypothetical protein
MRQPVRAFIFFNITAHAAQKFKCRLWIIAVFITTVIATEALDHSYQPSLNSNKGHALEQCSQQRQLKLLLSVTQVALVITR